MDGIKGFLQSKTVWVALVGFGVTLLQKYGYTVSDVDQAAIVDKIYSAVELGSYALAAYFRIKATKVVTSTPVA